MPNSLVLRYAARSDVGLVREKNDDTAYAGSYLAVVADGMGGHVGGDIASASTVLDLVHLDHDGYQGDAETQLADEIQTANSLLSEMVHVQPQLTGMGTTVTAILLSEDKLAFAHIGDSRAYRLKNGTFEQMSTDHTFVQRLIDEGRLTPEEAEVHPHKNVLMRVLGDVDASPELDLASISAEPGERWLLCSDGLNFVPQATVEQVVRQTASLADTADELIRLTLEAGSPDNVTVIVVEVAERGGQDTAKIDTALLRQQAEQQPPRAPSPRMEPKSSHASADGTGSASPVASPASPTTGEADLPPRSGLTSAQQAAALFAANSDDDADADSPLGEHLVEDVVAEELAEREHELVGAGVTAFAEGKIPKVASRRKHTPSAANLLTHRIDADDQEVVVTPDARHHSLRNWIIAAAVLVVIVIAGWLGFAWTQTQYYVGEANGNVAIYNGISQPLGPFKLSHVYSETAISMDSLAPFVQSRVKQTLTAGSLDDAKQIVQGIQNGKVPTDPNSPPPPATHSPSKSTSPPASKSPAPTSSPSCSPGASCPGSKP